MRPSIIAVHGLDGDRERTWTAENGKLWLKDFLPADVPRARILTYGFDARTHVVSGTLSLQTLSDHSEEFLRDLCTFREISNVDFFLIICNYTPLIAL